MFNVDLHNVSSCKKMINLIVFLTMWKIESVNTLLTCTAFFKVINHIFQK